jgi:hypothetical protein
LHECDLTILIDASRGATCPAQSTYSWFVCHLQYEVMRVI